jgi:membrane fusion protein (multidrug efflux system)
VSGVIARKVFEPGQRVKEGDLLFTIDPRSYDEAVINAKANLAEAQANLARVRQDIVRYQPLLADNAIPRQTYDQTVAQERQYKAIVEARRSNVASAAVQRGYADVRSPISGQIGLQQIEVGGLATAGQTVLATVSTQDPVAAYFSVSEVNYLGFARKNGTVAAGADGQVSVPPVDLILADGTVYSHRGTIDFADRALSSATGTLQLRAVFSNSESLLRPGMNARVRIVNEVEKDAILVPQRSVTELLGKYFVSVVGADNKVEQVAVTTGPRLGEFWVIRSGLKGGDVVITDGLQTAKAGQVVVPRPIPESDVVAPAQP